MRPARTDGQSHDAGRPSTAQALIALGIAVAISLVFAGLGGLLAVVVALVAITPVIFWASRTLDGQTGDVYWAPCSKFPKSLHWPF